MNEIVVPILILLEGVEDIVALWLGLGDQDCWFGGDDLRDGVGQLRSRLIPQACTPAILGMAAVTLVQCLLCHEEAFAALADSTALQAVYVAAGVLAGIA